MIPNRKIYKKQLFTSLTFLVALFFSNLEAQQILTVKQDGTGDYLTIQAGINNSQYGDTVLVWPGIYYENLEIISKSITLGSLNLITGDPAYIGQTIIDGDFKESCMKIVNNSIAQIVGFKITHGSGDIVYWERGDGGGIFIYISEVSLINCHITENDAWGYGGGICNLISSLFLSGTTISWNHAKKSGGGILADCYGDMITFDSINKCNIYNNFSEAGCDIYHPNTSIPLNIIVDTFSVLQPDRYHIEAMFETMPDSNYLFSALNAKAVSTESDLYVNPNGSDTNNGLTPSHPLKTIAMALSKMSVNPDTNRTIHLANGVYSKTTNEEKFPLNLRSYIDIIGESEDSTIFDGDSSIYFFNGNFEIRNYSVKNLTMKNGYGMAILEQGILDASSAIILERNFYALFENITILNTSAVFSGCVWMGSCNQVTLRNLKTYYSTGGFGTIRIGNADSPYSPFILDTINLLNCRIQYTMPSPQGVWGGTGGGLVISGSTYHEMSILVNIIGCEIVENTAIGTYPGYAVSAINFRTGVTVNLINSTIGNNSTLPGNNSCAIAFSQNESKLNVYNSIIYGNWPPQVLYGSSYYPEDTCELYIYNSLIEDGPEGILNLNPNNIYYYDLSNLGTDPLWDTASIYSYSLSESSPCIDAGTLDLPPGIVLPEFDLAGNPRVWGASVDMGAYEYGPWVSIKENPNSKFKIQNLKLLHVNPNPFTYGTYVSYELKKNGRLDISVYTLSGLKVRMLAANHGSVGDKGNFYWDGCDQNGKALPAGVYLIRMTMDGKEVETVKAVRESR
jgi:hypothetical protein